MQGPFGAARVRLRPAGVSTDAAWGVTPPAKTVAAVVAVLWAVVLLLILRHRVFVSHDSISNYGHVWWVSDRIWSGGGLPFRMPVIGHGKAFAFPYGFLPWFTASLLYPLLGDWVVTLWLVLGFLGLLAAMFWAFPEIRRGWWAATALVNPTLVMSPIIGQLPFIWGSAMLMAAIGCWRRKRYVEAAVLAGLGQATHPAVILPIALGLVIGRLHWEEDKRRLLRFYAISLVITLPATWIVFVSPVFVDSSVWMIISNFFGTILVRSFVIIGPILIVLFQRVRKPWFPVALFIATLGLNVALAGALDTRYAWGALNRKPDTDLMRFVNSPKFEPTKTYRIIRAGDGKIGMYQIVRKGGHLDSEFFPESIGRKSWRTTEAYSKFLRTRRVDFVIVYDSYDKRYRTNEHALLDQLSGRGIDNCDETVVGAAPLAHGEHYDVYSVRREC
ncbi:MAG: hypothetical protein M3046_12175 [Actinomycetota bacterium]|nr:hypothetical protein [Actinomycetota bacterium]